VTLLVSRPAQVLYQTATVIDRGPIESPWVKALLANGEECFVYSDSDNTIPAKMLDVGATLFVSTPRECRQPGPTKWTTNFMDIIFQTEETREYIESLSAKNKDTFRHVSFELKAKSKKPSVSVPYSLSRYEFIKKITAEKQFEGIRANSDAVAYIIDTCIAAGLLS